MSHDERYGMPFRKAAGYRCDHDRRGGNQPRRNQFRARPNLVEKNHDDDHAHEQRDQKNKTRIGNCPDQNRNDTRRADRQPLRIGDCQNTPGNQHGGQHKFGNTRNAHVDETNRQKRTQNKQHERERSGTNLEDAAMIAPHVGQQTHRKKGHHPDHPELPPEFLIPGSNGIGGAEEQKIPIGRVFPPKQVVLLRPHHPRLDQRLALRIRRHRLGCRIRGLLHRLRGALAVEQNGRLLAENS